MAHQAHIIIEADQQLIIKPMEGDTVEIEVRSPMGFSVERFRVRQAWITIKEDIPVTKVETIKSPSGTVSVRPFTTPETGIRAV